MFYRVHAGPPDRNQGAAGDGDEVLPQSVVSNQRQDGSLLQEIHQSHGPGPQFSQVRHQSDTSCQTTVLSKQKQHVLIPRHQILMLYQCFGVAHWHLRYPSDARGGLGSGMKHLS